MRKVANSEDIQCHLLRDSRFPHSGFPRILVACNSQVYIFSFVSFYQDREIKGTFLNSHSIPRNRSEDRINEAQMEREIEGVEVGSSHRKSIQESTQSQTGRGRCTVLDDSCNLWIFDTI